MFLITLYSIMDELSNIYLLSVLHSGCVTILDVESNHFLSCYISSYLMYNLNGLTCSCLKQNTHPWNSYTKGYDIDFWVGSHK